MREAQIEFKTYSISGILKTKVPWTKESRKFKPSSFELPKLLLVSWKPRPGLDACLDAWSASIRHIYRNYSFLELEGQWLHEGHLAMQLCSWGAHVRPSLFQSGRGTEKGSKVQTKSVFTC